MVGRRRRVRVGRAGRRRGRRRGGRPRGRRRSRRGDRRPGRRVRSGPLPLQLVELLAVGLLHAQDAPAERRRLLRGQGRLGLRLLLLGLGHRDRLLVVPGGEDALLLDDLRSQGGHGLLPLAKPVPGGLHGVPLRLELPQQAVVDPGDRLQHGQPVQQVAEIAGGEDLLQGGGAGELVQRAQAGAVDGAALVHRRLALDELRLQNGDLSGEPVEVGFRLAQAARPPWSAPGRCAAARWPGPGSGPAAPGRRRSSGPGTARARRWRWDRGWWWGRVSGSAPPSGGSEFVRAGTTGGTLPGAIIPAMPGPQSGTITGRGVAVAGASVPPAPGVPAPGVPAPGVSGPAGGVPAGADARTVAAPGVPSSVPLAPGGVWAAAVAGSSRLTASKARPRRRMPLVGRTAACRPGWWGLIARLRSSAPAGPPGGPAGHRLTHVRTDPAVYRLPAAQTVSAPGGEPAGGRRESLD